MPYIEAMQRGLRELVQWAASYKRPPKQVLSVNDTCPKCNHPGNILISGWFNPELNVGKCQWRCSRCGKIFTWRREARGQR